MSVRECPTVRPSCYLFLNHWVEFYQTCYIISPHSMGVQEKHYFSICSVARSCIRHLSICPSHYLLQNHRVEFNQTYCITSPHSMGFIIPFVRQSVLSSVRHATHPKPLGVICYITSPHSKCVREQHYFSVSPCVCCPSVTLSPSKPLGRTQPNLLHHFPSW